MKTPEEMAEKYCDRKYGFNNHEFDAFIAGYEAAQPQWISVKDRLPEIGHRILVTHRTSGDYANLKVMEAWRISDDEYCVPEDYSILAHDVDYWMPLPEPPEEK